MEKIKNWFSFIFFCDLSRVKWKCYEMKHLPKCNGWNDKVFKRKTFKIKLLFEEKIENKYFQECLPQQQSPLKVHLSQPRREIYRQVAKLRWTSTTKISTADRRPTPGHKCRNRRPDKVFGPPFQPDPSWPSGATKKSESPSSARDLWPSAISSDFPIPLYEFTSTVPVRATLRSPARTLSIRSGTSTTICCSILRTPSPSRSGTTRRSTARRTAEWSSWTTPELFSVASNFLAMRFKD